ncbi:MAG: CHASE2 domain-containing protein [Bryobacterales bacterium]|nr:CHASE2 domain-containing protein [Bryobacterales bacterium]
MSFSPMRIVASNRLAILGLAITMAAAAIWLLRPAWLNRFDHLAYDAQLRAAASAPLSNQIVIVEIDEASLARYGQWPWPRAVLGGLLNQIRDAGASVIALDVVFAEPEQRLASADPSGVIPSNNNPGESSVGDAVLRSSLEKGQVVVGHYFRFGDQRGSASCQLHPVSLSTAFRFDAGTKPYLNADSVTCSLAEISGAAMGSGFLNASPDADGILRRVPLVIGYGERAYPSLALAAVMSHRKLRAAQLVQERDGSDWLRLGGTQAPTGPYATLLLRYQPGTHPFARLSAAELPGSPGLLRGKIVLIGGAAVGLQDAVSTPIRAEVAGTEVHATAMENLLAGDAIRRSPAARTAELLILLFCGALSTWLIARFRPVAGGLGAAALILVTWLATAKYLDGAGVFVSPSLAIALVVLNVAALSVTSLGQQRARADRGEVQAEAARAFMVNMLGNLTMLRDLETGEHLFRMQRYAWVLSVALRQHPRFREALTPERIALIAELVPMHDMGKVGVADAILRKPGRLTPEEFESIKQHVAYGRDALLRAKERSVGLDEAIWTTAFEIVNGHHERWDGSGYPDGLKGEAISVEGRIVAVIDVYDALVSERVYKHAMSHEEALDILRQGSGTHFDPAVVEAFLQVEQTIRQVNEEIRKNPDAALAPWV